MKLEEIPIHCITLDRRTDRWKHVSEEAAKTGLKIHRFSAVDAKSFVAHKHPKITLATSHNIYYGTRRSHYEISAAGAIGCSLSHFKLWEQLLASSAPAYIVFEDDISLPVGIKAKLETVVNSAPPDWDVIQLQQSIFRDGSPSCKPIADQKPWQLCTSLMGTHAYIVSRRGAKRLLEKAYPIELHVDAYMAYMARMEHIRMLWNPLVDIKAMDPVSDIDHGNCHLCNVPSNLQKHGVVVFYTSSVIGMMAMAAVAGGVLALAFVKK
jgi:GR25 family glycosyltransferase involved in LPS biosynthesis